MEILNKVAYSFMLVLVIALMSSTTTRPVSGLFIGKTYVYIINNLGPNIKFNYHCKSADDDLGERSLNFNEEWHWKFQTNWFDTTLFWCNMWWTDTNGRQVSGSTDIYKAKRDKTKCYRRCRYYVKADGIYRYNSVMYRLDLLYTWPQ
ncbi:hypothetical protein AQUCO_04800027v1 [Aquilegia coerulea]|uniref:S-protein homolog n=1 Tax=Aquilegia coerulea TaxID=218851 RepID=A0A2G5CKJ9_AQUCA|nr:hypothetical protein AQUCO_04800027v1 [Aquilegia coerulea]